MPWEIVGDDPACPASKPWGVHKIDGGWLVGCHETKNDAEGQLAALHIAEPDASRAADDTYTPPAGVSAAAKRALKWIADGLAGDGFTDVGRRRASQLAAGGPVSRQTVGRMANYFGRHTPDRDAEGFNRGENGYPTPGRVAWDAWGGDAGRSWSTKIVASERTLVDNTEERELDEGIYPVSPRQKAQYDAIESIVELFGQYDQTSGQDGSHYVAASPFAADGMVCSSCVFYEGPRACEVVAGDIDPGGICKLWVIPEVLITGVQQEQPTPEVIMNGASLDGYTRTEDGFETPEKEVRQVHKLELRTDEATGLPVLEGYATVYDYRYDIGDPTSTGFTEVVSRGAAAKSAQEADVRLLINHDGLPLARTRSGTLELLSDEVGLRVKATLDPSNPSAAETISAMERGDVDQMSLAFRVLRQNYDTKTNVRTIQEMKLYDVSVVTFPANPATVVKLRDTTPANVEDAKLVAGRSVELARRQFDSDSSARR